MKPFSVMTSEKITRIFWLILECFSSYMTNKGESWCFFSNTLHTTFPECMMLFFFGSKVNFIYVTQYHSMSDAGYWKDMYQTFQTGGATCSSYYAKKKNSPDILF